jgi:heat shock protein HslJ
MRTLLLIICIISTSCAAKLPIEYSELSGLNLQFFSYNGEVIKGINPSRSPYISFDQERLHGIICNTFSGPYTYENSKLKSITATTMALCANDLIMKTERDFLNALRYGAIVYRTAGTITIEGSGSRFVFE